ncbi:hypothetical protein [Nocardia africana]|nr:hypothetical protein [Nocardia africana]MCC3314366.1 hypothetical protein [Nocardia africana]
MNDDMATSAAPHAPTGGRDFRVYPEMSSSPAMSGLLDLPTPPDDNSRTASHGKSEVGLPPVGLAAMFLLTASAHFLRPRRDALIAMVPVRRL